MPIRREMTEEQMELFVALTERQKAFAMAMLSGLTGIRAFRAADPHSTCSDKSASVYASKIKKVPGFVAFMNSVHAGMLSDAIITREEALERLSDIARSSLREVVDVSKANFGTPEEPDMRVVWDLSQELIEDPTLLDSIAEIQQGLQGPKIKMYSAVSAIQQIADLCGWKSPTVVDHKSVDGSMTPASTVGLDVSKLSTSTLHELVAMHHASTADTE